MCAYFSSIAVLSETVNRLPSAHRQYETGARSRPCTIQHEPSRFDVKRCSEATAKYHNAEDFSTVPKPTAYMLVSSTSGSLVELWSPYFVCRTAKWCSAPSLECARESSHVVQYQPPGAQPAQMAFHTETGRRVSAVSHTNKGKFARAKTSGVNTPCCKSRVLPPPATNRLKAGRLGREVRFTSDLRACRCEPADAGASPGSGGSRGFQKTGQTAIKNAQRPCLVGTLCYAP